MTLFLLPYNVKLLITLSIKIQLVININMPNDVSFVKRKRFEEGKIQIIDKLSPSIYRVFQNYEY